MAELISNQQMALAGFLAASALAHMPLQPELSPIKSPDVPPSDNSNKKRLEVEPKGAIKKSPAPQSRQIPTKRKPILGYAEAATGIPPEVMQQVQKQQHRLRFLLERQRQSLKRAMSIGKRNKQETETFRREANNNGGARWRTWCEILEDMMMIIIIIITCNGLNNRSTRYKNNPKQLVTGSSNDCVFSF